MPRKLSRKGLINKLDRIFSEYIRKKNANKKGFVKCYTCNKKKHFKDYMQCGHFISRRHYVIRWSVKNARPQCYGCNVMSQGQQYQFAINLNKEYNYDIAKELLKKSKETVKYSISDLEEMVEKYKNLLEKENKRLHL